MGNVWSGATGGNLGENAAKATEHTGEGAARTLAPAVTAAAGATQHTFRDAAEILEGIIGDLRRDVERLVQGESSFMVRYSACVAPH